MKTEKTRSVRKACLLFNLLFSPSMSPSTIQMSIFNQGSTCGISLLSLLFAYHQECFSKLVWEAKDCGIAIECLPSMYKILMFAFKNNSIKKYTTNKT